MTSILSISIQRAVSPWNERTNKSVHLSTRAALRCTEVTYTPPIEGAAPISPAIFVYKLRSEGYAFDHVAIPTELITVPVLTEGETQLPWVRQDYVDLLLPSFQVADKFIKDTESDIYFLAKELACYKKLIGPSAVTVEVNVETNESNPIE